MKLVLGIESSCDETAAAVIDENGKVLSALVASQVEAHAAYGGVVPDLAARMHTEAIAPIVQGALQEAGITPAELDAIAVTRAPGLIGCLLVGVSYAEGLALATGCPIYGVDHLEGHIWSGFMSAEELAPPLVALVVSGGHTALYRYDGLGQVRLLSRTVDDAAGEAFDKVAKLLDLPYPGGPAIQAAAESGNPKAYRFPRGRVKGKPLHFSFSGLKTAVLYELKGQNAKTGDETRAEHSVPDVAASFQEAVVDALCSRALKAVDQEELSSLLVCGGVAANARLRERLEEECDKRGIRLVVPPLSLCTDNGVMIAGLGMAYLLAGHEPTGLGMEAEARSALSRPRKTSS